MSKEFNTSYFPAGDLNIDSISALLNDEAKQQVDNLLWSETNYRPAVNFSLAYTDSGIALKYYVKEQYLRAECTKINDPVYEDSCVEFFIAFGEDKSYYNLEFNCKGIPQVGYGEGKQRTYLDKETIRKIKVLSNIQPADMQTGITNWELTLYIPFEAFIYNNISSLKGQTCRANFYKCGDKLPEPHFMSWNNIDNPFPEFHLPRFFGQITFN